MGMGAFLKKQYNKLMKKKLALFRIEQKKKTKYDLLQIALAVIREILTYGYLIYAVLEIGVSVADFTLYFSASMSFSVTLIDVFTYWEKLCQDSQGIDDMREMMKLPEEDNTAERINFEELIDKPIVMDDVSFRYPEATTDALSHISFTFTPGHRVAIVGKNGSGKTTLIKLLCGLLEPTSGCIRYGGY